jgi:uncharacterized damage-inducible protein DinB
MSHNISQSLLPEFDHEMANTRKSLERVPEGKGDFTPHTKSMTLAQLAGHIVDIPTWAVMTLTVDEFDVNPPTGPKYDSYVFATRADALARFDAEMKKAREALAATSDEQMMGSWALKSGGHQIMAMPRVAVFRSFVMNHMIHHRAQLGVYLRMNDVPVPGLYGPSADEQ